VQQALAIRASERQITKYVLCPQAVLCLLAIMNIPFFQDIVETQGLASLLAAISADF
jgi:hypothetical protein